MIEGRIPTYSSHQHPKAMKGFKTHDDFFRRKETSKNRSLNLRCVGGREQSFNVTPLSSIPFLRSTLPAKPLELRRASSFFPSLPPHPSTVHSLRSNLAWPSRSRQPSRPLKSHHACRSKSDSNDRHQPLKRSLISGSRLNPGFWQGYCNALQRCTTLLECSRWQTKSHVGPRDVCYHTMPHGSPTGSPRREANTFQQFGNCVGKAILSLNCTYECPGLPEVCATRTIKLILRKSVRSEKARRLND